MGTQGLEDWEINKIEDQLTLRDYFAAQAMNSLIHVRLDFRTKVLEDWVDVGYDTHAEEAYEMADAMLKARKNE